MSVVINGIVKKSIAEKKKFAKGDLILTIDQNPINDVLDYEFYVANENIEVELQKPDGTVHSVSIKKQEYTDIGVLFDTYLIDKEHSCTNNCIFCFVDQMPKGCRESLYFKDDDARLSFIFGNYITLTNMKQHEIDRIIKMHISPINISVHTTNPQLRQTMMNNRFAGDVLSYIEQLSNSGIKINCQLVLCRGINDGAELKRTLENLSHYFPSVQTIACVPVGLTKHREGLYPLVPYDVQTASDIIDIIEEFSAEFYNLHQTRLAFPADEFFIKANRDMPTADYYEDFTQLENGVGMVAMQGDEFSSALDDVVLSDVKRKITIATGVDAAPILQKLVYELCKKWHNLDCKVIAIKNEFFGETITVAGLVTGQDIITQLSGIEIGEQLLLPSCMLRHEQDKFLDDVTLEELKLALGVDVQLCNNDGYELLNTILGL